MNVTQSWFEAVSLEGSGPNGASEQSAGLGLEETTGA